MFCKISIFLWVLFFAFPLFAGANLKKSSCYDNFSDDISWLGFNYNEAKIHISEVGIKGIKTKEAYFNFVLKEDTSGELPLQPMKVYGKDWKGWNDFLSVKEGKSVSKFKTNPLKAKKKPANSDQTKQTKKIKQPQQTRKDFILFDWKGSKDFMSFEEAKAFIRSEGITKVIQFREWSKEEKRPDNFPSNPDQIYKESWKGWADFLGTKKVRNKNFMSFEEAKAFIKSEGVKTINQFRKWKKEGKRPDNFPSNPDRIYKENWKNWNDFLGTKKVRNKNFMSFEEAKAFIKSEGITKVIQFREWSKEGKRPDNFPSNPDQIYKENWKGWNDFLGTI